MRHFYFRLFIGVIWLASALINLVALNIPFALLYVALGVAFLYSAHTIWQKEKDNKEE